MTRRDAVRLKAMLDAPVSIRQWDIWCSWAVSHYQVFGLGSIRDFVTEWALWKHLAWTEVSAETTVGSILMAAGIMPSDEEKFWERLIVEFGTPEEILTVTDWLP